MQELPDVRNHLGNRSFQECEIGYQGPVGETGQIQARKCSGRINFQIAELGSRMFRFQNFVTSPV